MKNQEDSPLVPYSKDSLREYRRKAKILRKLIIHENEICNHRMYWLALVEGLLFAALGNMIKEGTNEKNFLFIVVICVMGIFISISFLYIFSLSEKSIDSLKEKNIKYCNIYCIPDHENEIIISIDHKSKEIDQHEGIHPESVTALAGFPF